MNIVNIKAVLSPDRKELSDFYTLAFYQSVANPKSLRKSFNLEDKIFRQNNNNVILKHTNNFENQNMDGKIFGLVLITIITQQIIASEKEWPFHNPGRRDQSESCVVQQSTQ